MQRWLAASAHGRAPICGGGSRPPNIGPCSGGRLRLSMPLTVRWISCPCGHSPRGESEPTRCRLPWLFALLGAHEVSAELAIREVRVVAPAKEAHIRNRVRAALREGMLVMELESLAFR